MLAKSNHAKLALDISRTLLVAIATNAILLVPCDQLLRVLCEFLFRSHAPNIAFLPSVFIANFVFNGFMGMIYGAIILLSGKRVIKSCIFGGILMLCMKCMNVFIRITVIHVHDPPAFLFVDVAWGVAQTVLSIYVSTKLIQWLSKE